MTNVKTIVVAVTCGIAVGALSVALVFAFPAARRADNLAAEAAKYREQSVDLASQLRDAQGSLAEANSGLGNLSSALAAAQGTIGRLSATNSRLGATVDQLAGVGGDISGGNSEALRLTDAIADLARGALATVRGLQDGGR